MTPIQLGYSLETAVKDGNQELVKQILTTEKEIDPQALGRALNVAVQNHPDIAFLIAMSKRIIERMF